MNHKEMYLMPIESIKYPHKIVCASIPFKILEDTLASFRSPLIILSKFVLNNLIVQSGDFKRNPYPYKPKTNKYDLYGDYIDVEIIKLDHCEIDVLKTTRILVIDRDNATEDFKYFELL